MNLREQPKSQFAPIGHTRSVEKKHRLNNQTMRLPVRSSETHAFSCRRKQSDVGRAWLVSVEAGCLGSLYFPRRLPQFYGLADTNAGDNVSPYETPSHHASLSDQS